MATDDTPKTIPDKKRELFQQADFPNFSISEGIKIAKTLSEQYGELRQHHTMLLLH